MRVLSLWLLFAATHVVAEDAEDIVEEDVDVGGGDEPIEEEAPVLVDGMTEQDRASLMDGAETHEFRAETQRLMDIIINSLYTNKGVYLRELLSNAIDALEKARFISVQDQDYLGDNQDLEVRVEVDPEAKTLTIQDSGVGMSKEELIGNLGTVAKSGTTNFLESLKEGADASLIGQFGVGFYAAFLVADKVTVTSISKDEPTQHVWESAADGAYTIAEDPRGSTLGRGTRVTLHMKEEMHHTLDLTELEKNVKHYSEFMGFPIMLRVEKAKSDDEDVDDDDEEPKQKWEWKQVNNNKPLWLRPKEEITTAEYASFYKAFAKTSAAPLLKSHFSAEGEIEFTAMLFIPAQRPYSTDEGDSRGRRVRLYVRRVLIAEGSEASILPKWLFFVDGIVDSDDLPLNVNREQLQQNKVVKVIRKKCVRKLLELLRKESEAEEFPDKDKDEDEEKEGEEKEGEEKAEKKPESKYPDFWRNYAQDVRFGCFEDDANRGKIAKLLRFDSSYTFNSAATDKTTSLDGYVGRMLEKQKHIYYMSGDSPAVIEKNANLEIFKKKGVEVLYLVSVHDEPCISKLAEYEGFKLTSCEKGDATLGELGEDTAARTENLKKMYEGVTKWWQEFVKLDAETHPQKWMNIQTVQISSHLVTKPVTIVSSQWGYSAKMEKAYMSQGQDMSMSAPKTLEINGDHPVIYKIFQAYKENPADPGPVARETAELLMQAAILQSGYRLDDPTEITKSVHDLLKLKRGIELNAAVTPVEVDLPPEEEVKEEDVDDAENVDDPDQDQRNADADLDADD